MKSHTVPRKLLEQFAYDDPRRAQSGSGHIRRAAPLGGKPHPRRAGHKSVSGKLEIHLDVKSLALKSLALIGNASAHER
jgi:hypothetical protein